MSVSINVLSLRSSLRLTNTSVKPFHENSLDFKRNPMKTKKIALLVGMTGGTSVTETCQLAKAL